MKTLLSAFTSTIICLLIAITPGSAFFGDDIDEIVDTSGSDTVEGISATAGNGSVILIWNSTYNQDEEEAEKYRVEYGTESVLEGVSETYESSEETIDNVPSIKIDDLENDTPYYFSVIAVFPDDSETLPSDEVSATPISELEQTISETPVVISAEAAGSNVIRVLFSEDVILPAESPELAFAVNDESDPDTLLEVISVSYDTNPNSGEDILSDVLVTTAENQQELTRYRVTVSAQITDTDGNPIESGSTDSAVFDAYESEKEVIPNMNEDEEDVGEFLFDEEEGLTLDDILNELEEEEFQEGGMDTTAPEDITDLVASFKARLTDFLVTLSWTPSIDSAGDLDDQLLYRSEDRGDQWSIGVSLGRDSTTTNIPERPETEVTYKITTTDVAGNESVGVIRSVSLPALPATGGGLLLLTAGIALAGIGMRNIKKKD
jgi:hypothetical protein